ncbi:MAG: hypothetical protein FWD16_02520 [Clostridia bacterium]|nr:hypothetical protein [Clostridia bacterium]
MTFAELVDRTIENIGKGQLLLRLSQLGNPQPPHFAEEQDSLEQELDGLRFRIKPAINQAYLNLARLFFPIHLKQSADLDASSMLWAASLTNTPLRYRNITHEGRPQIFMQRGINAEVFAPAYARVAVEYDGLPNPMENETDTPDLPAAVPRELLAFAATASYFAQEGQRATAAFWDARYKETVAGMLKQGNVRLPRRVWR